jgi:hypothetical protein
LEYRDLVCGLIRERSRREVHVCPQTGRILSTEKSVLSLRRLAYQNQPGSSLIFAPIVHHPLQCLHNLALSGVEFFHSSKHEDRKNDQVNEDYGDCCDEQHLEHVAKESSIKVHLLE